MTFSSSVKNELCQEKLYLNKCCNIAFLYGVFLFCKTFSSCKIKIQTENEKLVNIIKTLLKDLFEITPNTTEHSLAGASKLFTAAICGNDSKKIVDFYKINDKDNIINTDLLKKRCDRSAFLRGVFLCAGVAGDPNRHYHIEFSARDFYLAQSLCSFILGFFINLKITARKNSHIVYTKDSDMIIDLLNIMGAVGGALRFTEIKVLKDLRNDVNRRVNFETANLSKTANAAAVQIEAIEKIKKTAGLSYLPNKLRQVAILRLDNPGLSLSELGAMLEPRLSRSGVNHRILKIIEISKQF